MLSTFLIWISISLTINLGEIRPVVPAHGSSEEAGTFINPVTTTVLLPI